MKNVKEVWGLKFEVAGLFLVVFATVWQVAFTNWFEEQGREWQALIQEDANVSILSSQIHLANALATDSAILRKELAGKVYERNSDAYSKQIRERDKRREFMKHGQSAYFGTVRSIFLVLGTLALLIGKWLTLAGAPRNPPLDTDTTLSGDASVS